MLYMYRCLADIDFMPYTFSEVQVWSNNCIRNSKNTEAYNSGYAIYRIKCNSVV